MSETLPLDPDDGLPAAALGALVHYVARGSADGVFPRTCRVALVTEVGSWVTTDTEAAGPVHDPPRHGDARAAVQEFDVHAVHLRVFNPTGEFLHVCRRDEDGRAGGTWHLPCDRPMPLPAPQPLR